MSLRYVKDEYSPFYKLPNEINFSSFFTEKSETRGTVLVSRGTVGLPCAVYRRIQSKCELCPEVFQKRETDAAHAQIQATKLERFIYKTVGRIRMR